MDWTDKIFYVDWGKDHDVDILPGDMLAQDGEVIQHLLVASATSRGYLVRARVRRSGDQVELDYREFDEDGIEQGVAHLDFRGQPTARFERKDGTDFVAKSCTTQYPFPRMLDPKLQPIAKRKRDTDPRPHQRAFRCSVVVSYGGRCAISGCRELVALDAAHFATFQPAARDNSVENGILLRRDLHMLFDANIIGLEPPDTNGIGRVHFGSDAARVHYSPGKKPLCWRVGSAPLHVAALETRWEEFNKAKSSKKTNNL